jgi:hypothetical protein
VLVLGAGASVHLGFPLGRGLRDQVCRALIEDQHGSTLYDILCECGHSGQELTSFAQALRRSHQPSIDLFVEPGVQAALRPLAREAIAAALIPCESGDDLHSKSGWYEYLFTRIGSRLEHFEKSRISIITFNYDRSIDAFFFDTLKTAFGLDDADCAAFMHEHFPIVHVSGQLGALPTFANGSDHVRSYSTAVQADTVKECAADIKILSDGVADSAELDTARDYLARAQVICFLGFGYHETNIARLKLDGIGPDPKLVYGSRQGIFDGETEAIARRISGIQLGHETWNVQIFLQQTTPTILRDWKTWPDGAPGT